MAPSGGPLLGLLFLASLVPQPGNPEGGCTPVDSFDVGTCTGIAGDNITIPCGNEAMEGGNTTFLYVIIALPSEMDILANDSAFLQKHLAIADNGVEITCFPDDDSSSIRYQLNVLYPPTLLNQDRPAASYQSPYDLPCPLQGNPAPVCTWEIVVCAQPAVVIDPGPGVTFKDNNCTLSIAILNSSYADICFYCTATNELNSTLQYLTGIDFTPCSESRDLATSPLDGSVTTITVGDNITFACTAHGITRRGYLFWVLNYDELNPNAAQILISNSNGFDLSLCSQNLPFGLTNASTNNTGNYTCLFIDSGVGPSDGLISTFSIIVEEEQPTDMSPDMPPDVPLLQIILSSAAVLLLALVTMAILAIAMAVYLRRQHRSQQVQRVAMEDLASHDERSTQGEAAAALKYDVFLSFADEDREVVEKALKEPLEGDGYAVCWHHSAFIAGWTILENMEFHIGRSRMVVALLSESFAGSKFCQHELYIAFQRMRHKNVSHVLPVLLQEGCQIPPELARITYLNVRDNDFYERLCKAIGKPLEMEESHDAESSTDS